MDISAYKLAVLVVFSSLIISVGLLSLFLEDFFFQIESIFFVQIPLSYVLWNVTLGDCIKQSNPNPSDHTIPSDDDTNRTTLPNHEPNHSIPHGSEIITNLDLIAAFNHFDFNSLLDVSEINEKFHQLIAKNYIMAKSRLHEKTLFIKSAKPDATTLSFYEEHSDHSTVKEYELTSKLLRNFGYILTKLDVDGSDFDFYYLEKLIDQIEKYCAKTVVTIALRNMERMPIANWHPFESVTHVVFDRIELYKNVPAHRIFPNLRSLDIFPLKRSNLTCIQQHYPNMEHFGIHSTATNSNQNFVENLVQLNAHLQSLTIADAINRTFIEFLRDKLPNLKALHLISVLSEFFEEGIGELHFKSIADFTITIYKNSNRRKLPFPFTFAKLKSLTLNIPLLGAGAIESIVKNRDLRVLVIQMATPTYDQLKQILDGLPNLREIYSAYSKSAVTNGIGRIMAENTSLDQINVSFGIYQTHKRAIESIKPPHWQYIGDKKHQSIQYAAFRRKTSLQTNS